MQLVFLFAVYIDVVTFDLGYPFDLAWFHSYIHCMLRICTAWGVGLCGKGFVKCVVGFL